MSALETLFGALLCLAGANAGILGLPDLPIPPIQTVFDPFCIRLPPVPLLLVNPTFSVFTADKKNQFKLPTFSSAEPAVKKLVDDGLIKVGRQVLFLVHGWFGNLGPGWMLDVKDALLKKEDTTVIMVIWSIGADIPEYGTSASTTQTVASAVSAVAQAIAKSSVFKGNLSELYVHCVGHSLGAHICGQAGRKAKAATGKHLFDRVTGLDPSGPGFEICTDRLSIDKDSAACVDNIHTDGSIKNNLLPLFYFGALKSWGHIDFFPNGGTSQPACVGILQENYGLCNHLTVVEYFIESIKSEDACQAVGPCEKIDEMPKACGNETQSMGYFSSCHRNSTQRLEGNYYMKMDGHPTCKARGLGYIDIVKGITI